MRGEPADHLRKHYMILGPELVVYDLVVFRMSLGCIPLVPAPAIPCIVAFVVAAPQGYTGMVAQTADIVFSLCLDRFKPLSRSGIDAACKHEILPYQDAVTVAQVIEPVILVCAAAPYSQHVHVHGSRILYGLPVYLIGNPRKEHITRDVVGSFHEDRDTVENETEILAGPLGGPVEDYRPDADRCVQRARLCSVT